MRKKNRKQLADEAEKKICQFASIGEREAFRRLDSSRQGLSTEQAEERISENGENVIKGDKSDSWLKRLVAAFVNPFNIVLFVVAIVAFISEVILSDSDSWATIIMIISLIFISGGLQFFQESKSGRAAEKLKDMVSANALVLRDGKFLEIPMSEIVTGDIVRLSAGDMIPADMRILSAKDLFISQAALTGESEPVEKFAFGIYKGKNSPSSINSNSGLSSISSHAENSPTSYTYNPDNSEKVENPDEADEEDEDELFEDGAFPDAEDLTVEEKAAIEYQNICFMGTNVVSGNADAVVVATGNDTYFGAIAKSLSGKRAQTNFEKGVGSISKLLLRMTLFLVPVIFLLNGFIKKDWLEAFLFALAVAVGITPELLPVIMTSTLARGAISMSRRKTIVKNLSSIQSFGAMDILCTDKTGTLTEDKIILERYLDIHGNEDKRVLRHAYLNSQFQTGLKNLLDIAIIARSEKEGHSALLGRYKKVDEIPFDFTRRRMSVVLEDEKGKRQLIAKGAVEEMLDCCSFVEYEGRILPLDDALKAEVLKITDRLNSDGLRVIAVAQKNNIVDIATFGVKDESDMVLIGYVGFLDPPKESSKAAIKALHEHGVRVVVLTGDNEKVASCVLKKVGIDPSNMLLGADVAAMTDDELREAVEKVNLFAKLSPNQKMRVVRLMQKNGHTVGYMGDGINDAPALHQADVGISVDTAVDIAKESADIILLEKSLMVLEEGVIEGRKTFGNMTKYIKMATSGNFGNMFSLLFASVFLPFLPILPVQILAQNLLYDVSQITIPFDKMDKEYLKKPQNWDAKSIRRFMLWFGPLSSLFDIATFLILYYVFKAKGVEDAAIFQTGWFMVGLATQTLIVHLIRTSRLPIIKSRAALPVVLSTIGITLIGLAIPYTFLGTALDMAKMPYVFLAWFVGIIVLYAATVEILKRLYIKKYKVWI